MFPNVALMVFNVNRFMQEVILIQLIYRNLEVIYSQVHASSLSVLVCKNNLMGILEK